VVFTDLDAIRDGARLPTASDAEPIPFDANTGWYTDPSLAFAWLSAAGGPHAAFADDAIDALRALRAADVLRQRGMVLRTSGGFELCIDGATGNAVCTLRPAGGE